MLPGEFVINEILGNLERITLNLESIVYLIYFCERLNKEYSDIFELVTLDKIIEVHNLFRETFNNEYLNRSIVYNIVQFVGRNIDQINSLQLIKITKIISEADCNVKGIEREFLSYYSILNPELKSDLLHFYFMNKLIEPRQLLDELMFLKDSVDFNKFISTIIKCITSCEFEDLLVLFDEFSLNASIKELVEVKHAAKYHNLLKLKVIPIDQIIADIDQEYHQTISKQVQILNSEVIEIRQKLTSLWTNEFVDASNSTLSNYMISENISTPNALLENVSSPGRFVIGAGFGCFLTDSSELVIVNLDNGKATKVVVGEDSIYPVLSDNKIFIASNQELTIYNSSGEIFDINILEDDVVCLKATDNYVYCLTKNGDLYLYDSDLQCEEYRLGVAREYLVNDLIILEGYIAITTNNNLMIFKLNNGDFDLVKEYPSEEIIKILGIKNIIYIFESRSIKQLDIHNHTLREYKPLGSFVDNRIVIESEVSVVITFENKLVRINFSTITPQQIIIAELDSNKKITDLINCDGNFAIIVDDKSFSKIIKKDSIFEISAEYELNATSKNYLLSSGYGNLYVSSSDTLYQINNDNELVIAEEGDENVA